MAIVFMVRIFIKVFLAYYFPATSVYPTYGSAVVSMLFIRMPIAEVPDYIISLTFTRAQRDH